MSLWHAQELRRLLHNAMSKRSVDRLLCSYFSCCIFNILNQSEETFIIAVLLTVHLSIILVLTVHLSIILEINQLNAQILVL